jgi:tellurite resistance protein
METIFGIVIMILVFGGFRWLMGAGFKTAGAALDTARGRGSFSENMGVAFKGLGPMEIRFVDGSLGEDNTGPFAKRIEGRGLFDITSTHRIGFVTSVFDNTSGELEPVLSMVEAFQEPENVVYQHHTEVGSVSPDQGFAKWVNLGVVFPDLLQPPYSGKRELLAILRMIDLDDPPEIIHGFRTPDKGGLLWQESLKFSYSFEEKGYNEAVEHRDEARSLTIRIAMAVATSDGSFDEAEGETLKSWIVKSIEPFEEEKRNKLKGLYNDSLKEAYTLSTEGNLALGPLTERLNEIGEKRIKYETIELCFDIMAADGVADPKELAIIRSLSDALGLDGDEIERIKDQKIVQLDTNVTSQASIEDLLGIDDQWSNEKIRTHLREGFKKWNDRMNSLSEGEERDNAQRMLNLIAEARSKYV